MRLRLLLPAVSLFASACTPPEELAATETKSYVETNLDAFVSATTALCDAAPAPDADGWNATADAAAVTKMKTEWKKARVAYERVEGSIAVLFPELDASTDERYDGFVENEKDENLFDDQIVTGVHGIERILWSDVIPAEVKTYEEGLPNYVAAAFPANETQASDFKTKLCAKLVTDSKKMRDDYKPLALDTPAAFRGVIGSMEEQLEKTTFAATGEEESRYSKHTLADMRANLEGATRTYEAFRPWLKSKGQDTLDTSITAGLAKVKSAYDAISGESIPTPPATWSAANPSEADRATDFGKLYTLVENETATTGDALVANMLKAADALGIAALPE